MLTSPEATRTRALRKANRMNYHAIQTSGRTWSDPCGCTEHSGKRAEQRGSSGGHQLNTSIGGASSRNICSISSEISHNGWANRERGCPNEQGIPIAKPFSMTPPQCDGANHSRNSDCEPCAASRLSRFLRACNQHLSHHALETSSQYNSPERLFFRQKLLPLLIDLALDPKLDLAQLCDSPSAWNTTKQLQDNVPSLPPDEAAPP